MTKKNAPPLPPPPRPRRRTKTAFQKFVDRLTPEQYEALDDDRLILEYLKGRK